MVHYLNIPHCLPFCFVPDIVNTVNPVHFRSGLLVERNYSFQRKIAYTQKWQKDETTVLQIESTIVPNNLKLISSNRTIRKEFTWNEVFDSGYYKIYETVFNVSDVQDGVYYLNITAEFMTNSFAYISEKIHIKEFWPETLGFNYWHNENNFGVAYSTGVKFFFRIEAGILRPKFLRERTAAQDQLQKITTLNSIPSVVQRLLIGNVNGVAPWTIDLLNRIFCHRTVLINNVQYETPIGADFDINDNLGYPLIGASIEIVEAGNAFVNQQSGLEQNTGFAIAYDMNTDWFGGDNFVKVLEINKNN